MLVNLYTRKLHKHKRNYVECTDDEGRDDNYNQDANFVEADDFPKSLRKSKENGIKFIEEGNFSSPSTLSDEQNQRDEVHEEAEELAELEQISLPDSLSTNHISGPRPRLVVIKNEAEGSSRISPVRIHGSVSLDDPVKKKMAPFGFLSSSAFKHLNDDNPSITQHPQGSNLYLRLGAVVFGFGVMIMNGFRVADRFNEANNTLACHSELWVPVNVIHSIYVFWQTYFLFKYHRVVFNVQKFFIRFILSHMAVVNLGQWLSTVVQEVMVPPEEELEPKGGISATTLAPSMVTSLITHQPVFTDGNASLLQQMDTSKKNLSAFGEPKCHSQVAVFAHYLIPCGVEYSLIACAIFYKMFQRIGHVGTSSSEGGPDRDRWQIQHSSSRDGGSNNESTSCAMETRHQPKLRDSPTECHHAHKGLFVGLLLVMATLVVMALFYVLVQQRDRDYALVLYQITDLVLLSIGIVTVSVALYQLRVLHLRKLSEEDAFDDNLLLIGLLGMLFYDMFLLVPAVEAKEEHEGVGSIFVAKATLEMVQALLQVFLILEASQRQAGTVDQMVKKPGRTVVTFLLILNLAMWLVKTFELKHAESYPIYRRHYRGIAWKIITHLSLPLIIFFRFHSTVCLADIWTSAYRMHSSTDL